MRAALQKHVLSLRETLGHLQPATLADVHDIRDEALEIEDTLRALEAQIVPIVGVVEETLLKESLRHLRAQLQSWTDVLTTLYAHWHAIGEEDAGLAENVDRLFDEVLARDEGPSRARLLAVLARTLVSDVDPETGDPDPADDWEHDMQVLEWAFAPPQLHHLSAGEQQMWTCLVVTGTLTTMLWFLLSGTGAVVEGPGAVLHVVVWTGFALFVGVFFGLIAETA